MNAAFLDYYRCPERFANFALLGSAPAPKGYFRFGSNTLCYGRCSSNVAARHVTDSLHNALEDVMVSGDTIWLPFDPSEVAENLRHERYAYSNGNRKYLGTGSFVREFYYTMRPLLSVALRKHIQRIHLRDWGTIRFPNWPIDSSVDSIFEELMLLSILARDGQPVPFIWFWPEGLPACAIMTHDVETLAGRKLCPRLMDVDDAFAIKSAFDVVPEGRYPVSNAFLAEMRERGFEINIHDLDHDGRLFSDYDRFLKRAARINHYGAEFGASGFRSAILYRNVDWLGALEFAYDMSVPNVGSLEPQRGGCCSVTPFFIGSLLELPVTTTQDYCLFHILNQRSIGLWKRQISLICQQHGLVSFIVHPDYVFEPNAFSAYQDLLEHLAELRSEKQVWIARPGQVNQWWRERSQMRLVARGDSWQIEGPGHDRARIAYASVQGNRLLYHVERSPSISVPLVTSVNLEQNILSCSGTPSAA